MVGEFRAHAVDTTGHEKTPELQVRLLPPGQRLVQRWQSIPPSQTWFDANICQHAAKYFRQRGCTRGVALHPDSPRCHREVTEKICSLGKLANGAPFVIPEANRTRLRPEPLATSPFIVAARNALVAQCGAVALPCGAMMTRTACGAIRDETASVLRDRCYPRGLTPGITPNCSASLPLYDRLFVLSYKYDSAMGHFMSEVLPRVAFHMALLTDTQAPVHIHYGCDKKYGVFSPPLQYMQWLGLDKSRFVQGEARAKEVLIPRDGACQDLMFNRWEFMVMRDAVLERAQLQARRDWTVVRRRDTRVIIDRSPEKSTSAATDVTPIVPGKPVILVLQRSRSRFSARRGDVTRIWPDDFFENILTSIAEGFPQYEVQAFSDKNVTLMECLQCQVELFSRSSVLVGMHGAGLSNVMFMPLGALLVEITPGLDGRMLPGSGPFSRVTMATGTHHMFFHLLKEMQTFTRKGTTFDVKRLVEAMQQVLPVIGAAG